MFLMLFLHWFWQVCHPLGRHLSQRKIGMGNDREEFDRTKLKSNSKQKLKEGFKHIWCKLGNEEISFHEDTWNAFFLIVQREHGLPRVQAEKLLRTWLIPLTKQG